MNLYIVTGASRGLGLALAQQLSVDGDTRVVGVSRAGAGAGNACWRDVRTDLGTAEGQDAAAAAIVAAAREAAWDRAVLINNAGMLEPLGQNGALEADDIRRSIAVNLTASMVLMNAFLSATAGIRGRAVVNISSGSGRRPVAGSGAYCAAKAGLDMASRVAALEAESRGERVTITSLAPGIIDTDMQGVARAATEDDFPDVARFRAFKSDGLLKTSDEVAAKIIALERAGKLPAGIADLREL